MLKTTKHSNCQDIQFFDFSGGLNYLLPADLIEPNEAVMMNNLLIDPSSGLAVTRPVFSRIARLSNVTGSYFSKSAAYIVADGRLYTISEGALVDIGQVSGTKAEFAEWDSGVVIATASEMIYIVKNGLLSSVSPQNPEKEPICPTHVFVRFGRVVIYRENSDTLYYSNVGEAVWSYGELESDAKYVEIGYKDAGDIAAVVPLSSDIIVFKTSGYIYRLKGEYPNWSVLEVARNTYCLKGRAAIQLANSVIFMTSRGLMSLDTVQSYGDIAISKNLSRKIDPVLSESQGQFAELYYISSLQSIYINDPERNENFVMSLASNAFTRWTLPFFTRGAGEYGGKLYFAAADGVYTASDGVEENGEIIESRLVSKTYQSLSKLLLKETTIFVRPDWKGLIKVTLGNLTYSVRPLPEVIAFLDDEIAYGNKTPLVQTEWQKWRYGDVFGSDSLTCRIDIVGRGAVRLVARAAIIGKKGDD